MLFAGMNLNNAARQMMIYKRHWVGTYRVWAHIPAIHGADAEKTGRTSRCFKVRRNIRPWASLPPGMRNVTSPVWGGVIGDDEFLYRRTAQTGSIWTVSAKAPRSSI